MSAAEDIDRTPAEVDGALGAMIRDPGSAPASISDLFDSLPSEARIGAVRRLTRRQQSALYAKVAGFRELALGDLVPSKTPDLVEVRHYGRNTLPAFRIFEKRFCRLPGTDPESPASLAGYNFQTMAAVTGPGYFVAVEDSDHAEVLVDYRRLPEQCPADWPAIRSNESGLARFVYGFMVDRLRRVSEHVTIGSAARNGRDLGSYFALCRAD